MRLNQIDIDDPRDPRIAGYAAIRERDLAGRDGLFVAEGKVVLSVLFSARRFEAESVLVLDRKLPGLSETLTRARPDMPVYVASQPVLDAIAGFHIHRGILALGRRLPPPDIGPMLAGLPQDALVLVLAGISNHDNVGSIFRNAAAFEADAVLLDERSCDPLYRKAIRVSVGAVLKVPFATAGRVDDLYDILAQHGFEQLALSPAGAADIGDIRSPGRVALYLGSEGDGLPRALMQRMRTVRIAMSAGFDSLNVAAASAIALHRLWRGRPGEN